MASSALGSQSIALLQLPSGTLIDFAGTVEPSGWLLCDGRAVSRSEYATLFAEIGTSYGTGDGSTTFNIPDFRGRFARYNDNMGTAAGAAGRDTSARAADKSQGQATATNGLSVSASTNSAGEHTHSYYWGSMAASAGTGGMYGAGWNNSKATSSAGAHSHTVTTSITGDTETRPINLACNKLIKI